MAPPLAALRVLLAPFLVAQVVAQTEQKEIPRLEEAELSALGGGASTRRATVSVPSVSTCRRGKNCTFVVDNDTLQAMDSVVLMSACDGDPLQGFPATWTSAQTYLLHDPATWYAAAPGPYKVCWSPPAEDKYFHVADVELWGAYARDYNPVLGEQFSAANVGFQVADGDRMRLRRSCGNAAGEEVFLEASSSGMVYNFGLLSEDRVEPGGQHLCWCQEHAGEPCNDADHFMADSGEVIIMCPAGQELVAGGRRCEECPAGKYQPTPGLDPCLECTSGQAGCSVDAAGRAWESPILLLLQLLLWAPTTH